MYMYSQDHIIFLVEFISCLDGIFIFELPIYYTLAHRFNLFDD